MKHLIGIAAILLILCGAFTLACRSKPASSGGMSQAPISSPKPPAGPLIAYLSEGNLVVSQSDGSGQRMLAIAPEGEVIQDFIWSLDGSRIYFSIGRQFFEVVVETNNVANAGELSGLPGVTIDRLEMGRDSKTIIIHGMDADAAGRILALTVGAREARELSIDEYMSLSQLRPPVVRSVGEMSVSPTGKQILYKGLVGTGEELFVADIETGAGIQITNLYELSGFEESVETEGGRRVIEAAWSPDGRYIIFNPMQSCSETGLCYGRLFLVEAWGGVQLQLSVEMMVTVPLEWTTNGNLLAYDDGSRVVITGTNGFPKALSEGNHPKWQPNP